MQKSEITNAVVDIVVNIFAGQGIDPLNALQLDLIFDLGMDSILFMSLLIEIEKRFDIVIPDEKISMNNFRTVEDITCTILTIVHT